MSNETDLHALLDDALALRAKNPALGSRDREQISLLLAYIAHGLGVEKLIKDPWPARLTQDMDRVAQGKERGSFLDEIGAGV